MQHPPFHSQKTNLSRTVPEIDIIVVHCMAWMLYTAQRVPVLKQVEGKEWGDSHPALWGCHMVLGELQVIVSTLSMASGDGRGDVRCPFVGHQIVASLRVLM